MIYTSMTEPWTVAVYSGRMINVSNLQPEDIDLRDIAHALSLQCRYNGHCRFHYSVAQHSVAVCNFVLEETNNLRAGLVALLHDASEAYISDIVRGCKRQMPAYCELEAQVQDRIFKKLGLIEYQDYHDVVKKWDNRVLKSEVLALIRGKGHDWPGFDEVKAAQLEILELSPGQAEDAFLVALNNLSMRLWA